MKYRARPSRHESDLWRRFILVMTRETIDRLVAQEPHKWAFFNDVWKREVYEVEKFETPDGKPALPAG